jgi:hypothetical protein
MICWVRIVEGTLPFAGTRHYYDRGLNEGGKSKQRVYISKVYIISIIEPRATPGI